MNLDSMYAATRIEHEHRLVQLERARQAREATSGESRRPGMARQLGTLLSRFQGMPKQSGMDVAPAKPGPATA